MHTGRVTKWNPAPNGLLSSLAVGDGHAYLGGAFTRVGGRRRNKLAAVNLSTGALLPWRPRANGAVTALAAIDGTVYVGGEFTAISGTRRNHLAALDGGSGAPTTWNPGGDIAAVSQMLPTSAGLVVGGFFTSLGAAGQQNLGIFAPASARVPKTPMATTEFCGMPAMRRDLSALLALVALVGGAGTLTATTARAQTAGGQLDVLTASVVDSFDPGYWYNQLDYMVLGQTTQRWLYAWKPGRTVPTPDVAADLPRTSTDGKTVTIKIRPGIRYSAPLAGRTVVAADIAYALTRDLTPRTGNGYAGLYYADIVGARDVLAGRTDKLAGVETPNRTTLVIHLVRPSGLISNAQALALPGTSPVPEDYARHYDKGSFTTYGGHQVFTGPYVITSSEGEEPLELARNSEWNGRDTGDFRPAYLDVITVHGVDDPDAAGRQILLGTRMLSANLGALAARTLDIGSPRQRVRQPQDAVRFIALNTRVSPFDQVNVRRAVAAVVDKQALLTTSGGARYGAVATHFLPPGIRGFAEAGGAKGPGFDFTTDPRGNVRLARTYLRRAGYRNGRYRGRRLLLVGLRQQPAAQTARLVARDMRRLGFRLRVRLVTYSTMLLRYCGRPRTAAVAICPTAYWQKDFFDAQSLLDPAFSGANLASIPSYNYSGIDSPEINRQLRRANALTNAAVRASLYGRIDREITGQAYVIPWLWTDDIYLRARDVRTVMSRFNSAWDLTFTAVQYGTRWRTEAFGGSRRHHSR